jgi:hypothetical protein
VVKEKANVERAAKAKAKVAEATATDLKVAAAVDTRREGRQVTLEGHPTSVFRLEDHLEIPPGDTQAAVIMKEVAAVTKRAPERAAPGRDHMGNIKTTDETKAEVEKEVSLEAVDARARAKDPEAMPATERQVVVQATAVAREQPQPHPPLARRARARAKVSKNACVCTTQEEAVETEANATTAMTSTRRR